MVEEEIVRVYEPNDKVPPFQMLASVAPTQINWLDELRMDSRPYSFAKTCIMATIGPTSNSIQIIEQMIEAGMRVARLNLSYNSLESYIENIENIRQASKNYSKKVGYEVQVAIAADCTGPMIYTGNIEGRPDSTVLLEEGQTLKLTTDKAFYDHCTKEQVFIDYDSIQKVITIGSIIYIDKGLIKLLLTHVQGNVLTTTVIRGQRLGSRKLVNLPNTDVDLPNILNNEKDLFKFALSSQMDIILMPFVRNAAAIRDMRTLLGPNAKDILIFAKLQNHQGLENIVSILEEADGIVLISSVLNTEVSDSRLFQMQKYVLLQANLRRKPGIVCSQFMVNMKFHKIPSANQVNDVCSVILDGAHCIMLNSVTAIGPFPVEAVKKAVEICKHGESTFWQKNFLDEFLLKFERTDDFNASVAAAARLSYCVHAAIILTVTTSGKTAFCLAQFQTRCMIVAVTKDERTARRCMVYRGIFPVIYREPRKPNWRKDVNARIAFGIEFVKIHELVKTGDPIVLVIPTKKEKRNNVQLIYATPIAEKIFAKANV